LKIEFFKTFYYTIKNFCKRSITLSAGRMAFRGGGLVSSSTLRTGSGGNMTVKATESIELVGVEPSLLTPSAISSSTLGSGAAGNLTLNTPRLILRDGGRIDASTGASGAAGSVAIDAPESVEVSGRVPGSVNPSLVISSANILDESLRKTFGLPPIPTGVSGNVTINTRLLSLTEGAQVTVRNDGTGDAGTLQIEAASIFLDGSGGITASTQSGEGGNIALTSNDIRLRHGSEISATAGRTGNGGNIAINTDTLLALENRIFKHPKLHLRRSREAVISTAHVSGIAPDGVAKQEDIAIDPPDRALLQRRQGIGRKLSGEADR
jgi:large exoprotein involved in heme utilization and adhesion